MKCDRCKKLFEPIVTDGVPNYMNFNGKVFCQECVEKYAERMDSITDMQIAFDCDMTKKMLNGLKWW